MTTINTSGINPVEFKILVQIEETEKVTKGGIILTEQTVERDKMVQVKGRLIAAGSRAFEDFGDIRPYPGDRVMIAKYAGLMAKGDDGREYRVCSDKDVAAVLS